MTNFAYDLGVVGLGYVGLPLAVESAKSKLNVVGYDVDSDRVEEINNGKSPIEDISNDEHLKQRSWFQEINDTKRNVSLRYPGFPYQLSNNPPSLRIPAPLLGEHTDTILSQLNYTDDKITELRKKEIIK